MSSAGIGILGILGSIGIGNLGTVFYGDEDGIFSITTSQLAT